MFRNQQPTPDNHMKYLFTLVLTLVLTLTAFAQNETVQVDITKLSQQELQLYQQLKQKQASAAATLDLESLTPEKVDKYAQMGKGLGIAINEGLGAVTKNVEEFSQTSAGKWLMVLITWKVMGVDAIGLARTTLQWAVGLGLFIVGIPFWIWLIRRNCVLRPVASVEKLGFWTKKITYDVNRYPLHNEYILAYGACFAVYLGLTVAIMFTH